jgi:hypothetical protein
MNSSISSSEPRDPWRRFCRRIVVTALLLGGVIYGFVFILDPFDTLSLSPPFDRSPIATNARWSFPALARKAEFDSLILGTSTSRLLRPAELDPLFGAHFVNLAMNSATPYEQGALAKVFVRAHPTPKVMLIGLDDFWCRAGDAIPLHTERSFPDWMYDDNPWNDYLEQFSLYAVEQAGIEFSVLTGIKPRPYGRRGYTDFLPDESSYDLARARTHLYRDGNRAIRPEEPPVRLDEAARRALNFPAHPILAQMLASMLRTLKLVYFVPYHIAGQPRPGSLSAAVWGECKARIAALVAQAPNARLVDFMIASPITTHDDNYWDEIHFRKPIATWLAHSLRDAADAPPGTKAEGYVVR